ncbi:glycoside hydrolase family 5 protein [Jiangella rhizosphaerae]|uniref:Glycoside hydrolase family 5 protein n=1 Tax=Jiangella rhizosphaerae TaxID=2293569 RepID=A0A418KPN7_9ACTN|nr:glycoside hydrolase family 5 protein [Jiangella rhizosphaerae]RIQ21078.1 glycoside hydrolase family 5 protein [Jiangella rhizosphaerae]
MTVSGFVAVDGSRLVGGDGSPLVLRGLGLGGWMNMENFITGYPSTESLQRKALRRVLGDEAYERFFDSFLTSFFTDDDAAHLASLGLNSLRVPFNYRHFEDDDRPFELKESGFRRLDTVVDACARHGIYTILDLHALPGAQNQHWHSDNPTHYAQFWNHRHFQDRVVHLWEALADRYKTNPWVAGYNPVNEPGDATGEVVGPFYQRLEAAIRAVDPHHVLFLDGNRYSTEFHMFGDPLPNTVYTAHDYALPGFVDGGPYPGESRGQYVDRAYVEKTFLARTEFMRNTGTPIWIGEFGPVYTGDPARDEQRYRLLEDQLTLYREHGASWALWTYKDIGLQGLTYARADSPYLRRIAPVLKKKARLGVDAWGSVDDGVRSVLDPIDELFEKEFPDYAPFPWGRKRWVDVLVRHILLAEPMAGDFARCFEGVTPDEAAELGASFAFAACDRREPLADLLARYAS